MLGGFLALAGHPHHPSKYIKYLYAHYDVPLFTLFCIMSRKAGWAGRLLTVRHCTPPRAGGTVEQMAPVPHTIPWEQGPLHPQQLCPLPRAALAGSQGARAEELCPGLSQLSVPQALMLYCSTLQVGKKRDDSCFKEPQISAA